MQALTDNRADLARPAGRVGRVASLRRRVANRFAAMSATVVLFIAGGVGVANASTTSTSSSSSSDLTNGAGDTFFTSLTNYFTGHVLISVLALLALVVGAGMLIRWGSKTAKKA